MNDVAKLLSNDLATLVERTGASIVRVQARRRVGSSGIAWAPDVVLTASHAIEDDEDVTVFLPDGKPADAAVAGRDPATDVAVLRVGGATLAPPPWAAADALRVGN